MGKELTVGKIEFSGTDEIRNIKKILKRMEKKQIDIDYKEYPTLLDNYSISNSEDHDFYQAIQEMKLCYLNIYKNQLDAIERFTINHTFGMPHHNIARKYYKTMNRAEQCKVLESIGYKVTPKQLKRIRAGAMRKLMRELI